MNTNSGYPLEDKIMNFDEQEIMRAEVKPDVYGGNSCDQVIKQFEIYSEGDMDSETTDEDIVISLSALPPGARVSVTYPCCPECGEVREDDFETVEGGAMKIVGHKSKCQCGFDWDNWVLEQYS